MQLGQFLECEQGEPTCSEPVSFYLLVKTPTGRKRVRVRASLQPVSEAERRAAKKSAIGFLRTLPEFAEKDGILPPIPPEDIEFETNLQFLAKALVDAEDQMVSFVGAGQYARFRDGVVKQQVEWLYRVYLSFIEREYPEILSDSSKLEDEAEKKSGPGQPL